MQAFIVIVLIWLLISLGARLERLNDSAVDEVDPRDIFAIVVRLVLVTLGVIVLF